MNQCADEGASTCGRDGTCDGAGACRRYASGTVCGGGELQRRDVDAGAHLQRRRQLLDGGARVVRRVHVRGGGRRVPHRLRRQTATARPATSCMNGACVPPSNPAGGAGGGGAAGRRRGAAPARAAAAGRRRRQPAVQAPAAAAPAVARAGRAAAVARARAAAAPAAVGAAARRRPGKRAARTPSALSRLRLLRRLRGRRRGRLGVDRRHVVRDRGRRLCLSRRERLGQCDRGHGDVDRSDRRGAREGHAVREHEGRLPRRRDRALRERDDASTSSSSTAPAACAC